MRFVRAVPLVGACLVLPALSGGVGAQGNPTIPIGYAGAAAADGIRVTVDVPEFVAVERIADAGATTAQAALSSLAGPTAFASHPYPGDLVVALPGLAKIFGFPADLPPYPLFVSASATAPEQQVDSPLVALRAQAAPDQASALARSGADGDVRIAAAAGTATARRTGDGTVTSIATTRTDVFQVGPLRLAGIHSEAKAVAEPNRPNPELTSLLEVGSVTVGDVAATIGPDGLALAGTAVPLPDGNPLAAALQQAGVTVEYLAGHTGDDTVVSPTLRVRVSQTIPGVNRKAHVTYLLGQSAARAAAATEEDTAEVPPLPAAAFPPTSGPHGDLPGHAPAGPTAASERTPALLSAGQGAVADQFSGPVRSDASGPPVSVARPEPGPSPSTLPSPGPSPEPRPAATAEVRLATTAVGALYGTVAAGGLLALLALHAIRRFGLRQAWLTTASSPSNE